MLWSKDCKYFKKFEKEERLRSSGKIKWGQMSVSLLLLKVLNMFLDGEKGTEERTSGEGRRQEMREEEGRERKCGLCL